VRTSASRGRSPRSAELARDLVAYSLYVRGKADDELEKLPQQAQDRINPAIDALADDPYPQGHRNLQGREGYRIRVGDYRVLYLVDDEEPSVTVTKVAHRREVYRG
jgi:mRNA interferase RelE/StbE